MEESEDKKLCEYDFLESYFFWKNTVEKLPEQFGGLKWPLTSLKWSNLIRGRGHTECPICHQIGSYAIEVDGKVHVYKCLCNVARWTWEQEKLTENFRDPFSITPWGTVKPTDAFGAEARSSASAQEIKQATQNALNGLKSFVSGITRWHLLRGGFGCGKSTMLKMVASELYPIATYVTLGNLKNKFREEATDGDLPELINALSKTRILLLDDAGMEYDGSGFTSKSLRNIIDNRMAFALRFPTIMTTNLSIDEMDLWKGRNPEDTRAIVSRFLDRTYSDVHLLFQGDARRVSFQKGK